MSLIEKARQIVRNYSFKKDLRNFGEENIGDLADEEAREIYFNGNASVFLKEELNGEILAASLHYFIEIELKKNEDENESVKGVSKIRGLPHLPDSVKWPEDYYFYAQLNCKELTKYDIYKIFPEDGMIYIFFKPDSDEYQCKVIYYGGDTNTLSVINYPSGSNLPNDENYQDKFINNTFIMKYIPRAIFYIGGEGFNYSKITGMIPDDLKKKISEVLNFEITGKDVNTRILGRPAYWQGEDEFYDDGDTDQNDFTPHDNILLLQDNLGDGNIHFWINKESLKNKDFNECFVTYSGT